ncbi:phage tail protein [Kluyvera georgiana]|uniref:phage tail protein n=1 Tax=Kluyvera georgiana TaxID=73098 RepID=UPI003AF063C8
MTTKYFAILTNQGAARLANATALGTKLNITQMAVGDGGGTLPTPDPAQTKLVNQTRIAPINSLGVAANDAGQIIAEQIIPENEGGFFIREIGLYDDDGVLIAVANCPETYKPLLAEGSGRTQTIRMILVVSSTSAITLKIDPSVVLATRKYVDDAVIEVKSYADKLMKDHEAKANPHKQYPLIENALKEMADAGLINKVLENLGLKEAVTLGQFTSLRSGTGYRKSPDGHIKMWGTVITSTLAAGVGGSWSVALPTAFPNAMLTASVSLAMGATGGGVFVSVMDVGSPFTGTADTRLPASKATTIGGYVVNGMSAASKILLRWECEGY